MRLGLNSIIFILSIKKKHFENVISKGRNKIENMCFRIISNSLINIKESIKDLILYESMKFESDYRR